MRERRVALVNRNSLRLGSSAPIARAGERTPTLAERWDASWENNLRLAQMADAIGIECMVPIGAGRATGRVHPNGSSFESIAWACGLLAATRRLHVFCTVQVPLHHPLVAASKWPPGITSAAGAFGVNIVLRLERGRVQTCSA